MGIVGAKLIYPHNRTIQHAGVVFSPNGKPFHIYRGRKFNNKSVNIQKDYNAVTGACMLVKKQLVDELNGFDEKIPLGWGVDIDYTYAVEQLGLKVYLIDYWVNHHPNYETGHEHEKVDNINELKNKAFEYMRKKWKLGEYSK